MSVQSVTSDAGDITAVIVPIEEWKYVLSKVAENEPERNDTEYLLQSKTMKKPLMI